MVGRINSDLANDFGNLAQRSLSMINKNCAGLTPRPGPFTAEDQALLRPAAALLGQLRDAFDRQQFHEGLEQLWQLVRAANGYVDRQAPWALKKTDPARMATVLFVLADVIRRLALLLQPVMPASIGVLLDQLAVPVEHRSFSDFDRPLRPGVALPAPEGVFPAPCRGRGGRSLMSTLLVDSHCHLDFPEFSEDFDLILRRADQAGVGRMLTILHPCQSFPAGAGAGRAPRTDLLHGRHPSA